MRSVFIFGNGLGMALDPAYFSLPAALNSVWNSTDYLSLEHKALIVSAIAGATHQDPPRSEDQLDLLHHAIASAQFLSTFQVNGGSWLTTPAQQLPFAFKRFVHEVAMYFHRSGLSLPNIFVDLLAAFLRETKSHVATLNYDPLLYDALRRVGVLDGFSGPLIDGFTNAGFSNDNLERRWPTKHGWYMHLHGSPLYVGNSKMTGANRVFLDPHDDNHIVLTHVQHKPYIIASSPILRTYWHRLEQAIGESEVVCLFGYSGCDMHLNQIIRSRIDKQVKIVEWCGPESWEQRFAFWNTTLGRSDYVLYRPRNILEFADWYWQQPVKTFPS